jgi:hypothetical protein
VQTNQKGSGERSRYADYRCDYHPAFEQIAFVDTATGDCGERRLEHREGAEKFYRDLAAQGMKVRVGMEASGHARWFERLLAELNFELGIGDATEIARKRERKQKTDRQDAQHAVDGRVFMSFVIPLQFGHWSRLQPAGNESDSTCWHWLPIWVTSISTLPTGSWVTVTSLSSVTHLSQFLNTLYNCYPPPHAKRPSRQRLRCVLGMLNSLEVKVLSQPDGGEG